MIRSQPRRIPLNQIVIALLVAGSASALFAQAPSAAAGSITAQEAISRIIQATGAKLPPDTVDTIKAGDAATPVTGIATTFTPTTEVLRKAVAAGDNLIVTHEPTFYNHLDAATLFNNDPVYKEKLAYLNEHHLVVWRFHDGWHMRVPDGIAEGFAAQAGWLKYENSGPPADAGYLFTLPPSSLQKLAQDLQRRFHARSVRVVGDPKMTVTRVAAIPGAAGEAEQVQSLERDDVEVLVVGESREWETVEYVRDAQLQGRKKALILLGHLASEEAGMENCARWLRGIFADVPVHFIPATEPYWTPQSPPKAAQGK